MNESSKFITKLLQILKAKFKEVKKLYSLYHKKSDFLLDELTKKIRLLHYRIDTKSRKYLKTMASRLRSNQKNLLISTAKISKKANTSLNNFSFFLGYLAKKINEDLKILKAWIRVKIMHLTKTLIRSGHKTKTSISKTLATLLSATKHIISGSYYKLYRLKFRIPRIRLAAYIFSATALLILSGALIIWFVVIEGLPSAEVLAAREIVASTKIYDRNGELLYKIYKDENRTPTELSSIPDHVIKATLAIEDSEFYTHPGFSVKGMVRAMIRNYQRGELTGGSTITQQLVKNTLLTPEKTLTRKLREIVLAVKVEMEYSKDEILEMYLNEVSYGGTAYGIQEAAVMYFNKNVKDLNLAEAALLAGLPMSPTDYSPFGSNPEASMIRRLEVLRLMEENGFITYEERIATQQEQITFAVNRIDMKAPHFVMYVRQQLEQKYGKEMVEQGGLEVYTTLDYEVQTIAEEVVKEEVEKISSLNVGNGAAVVMSPSSGQILAMVGSKNYFDYDNDGNVNVITALRQPGSAIKIVNYAYALSNGYTLATIIDDSPVTFIVKGSPPYQPRNYDGGYRGRISLRSALAESRNVPAVKVLDSYGVNNMIEHGKKMGITTWEDQNRFGLSLTLGGGEVRLLDLAKVYATVANYGKSPDITTILKVTDYKGNVLESNECKDNESSIFIALADRISSEVSASQSAIKLPFREAVCEGEKVLDPRVAFMLTDILKDNSARTPAFGSNSLLNIHGHPEVAVKTGTTNNLRDNFTIGYNQNYLVAVWVGNNDNTPMSRIASGITGASPIFNKIMSHILYDQPSSEWIVPSGLVKLDICPYTATLPCSGCPITTEWFLEENQPEQHCSREWFEDDRESNENDDRPRNQRMPAWIRDRFNN